MTQTFSMCLMGVLELALWVTVGLLFWKKKLHRQYPFTARYLLVKIVCKPFLILLTYGQTSASVEIRQNCALFHQILFWTAYLACAILLFFICIEIFRSALRPYPALMKFGVVIVRWVAAVSVIVSFASAPFVHRHLLLLSDVTLGFMWAVNVVQLCLLTFLCLSMKALRLSFRDFAFGLAVGLTLMSAADLLTAAFLDSLGSWSMAVRIIHAIIVEAALAMWIVYCVQPDRERKPATSANSTVYRWNEIAGALGHNGARVAVQQRQTDGFFLTDVERVVDKVLNRNLKSNESGS